MKQNWNLFWKSWIARLNSDGIPMVSFWPCKQQMARTLVRYLLILDQLKLDSISYTNWVCSCFIHCSQTCTHTHKTREKIILCLHIQIERKKKVNRVLRVSKFTAWFSALIKALTYTPFALCIDCSKRWFCRWLKAQTIPKIEKYFNNWSPINRTDKYQSRNFDIQLAEIHSPFPTPHCQHFYGVPSKRAKIPKIKYGIIYSLCGWSSLARFSIESMHALPKINFRWYTYCNNVCVCTAPRNSTLTLARSRMMRAMLNNQSHSIYRGNINSSCLSIEKHRRISSANSTKRRENPV